MIIVMGPFVYISASKDCVTLTTLSNAFVPENKVYLDYDKIYKILFIEAKKDDVIKIGYAREIAFKDIVRLYYVIYEADNEDIEYYNYKAYLAEIPKSAKELEKLEVPRCPYCGSWDIEFDADEMICRRCRAMEFWHTETMWKSKQIPAGEQIIQGKGIYFVENAINEYRTLAGHYYVILLEKLKEGEEVLGNIDVRYEEFIGCIDESRYDETPQQYDFGIYKRYYAKAFDKNFVVKIRDLTDDEKIKLFNSVKSDFTKLCIAYSLPQHVGVELVLQSGLYKKFQWLILRGLDHGDGRIREACIKDMLEELRKCTDIKKAAEIAYDLKSIYDYEDDETKNIIERYKQMEMQKEMKIREELEKAFEGLPVKIEVFVTLGLVRVRLEKYIKKEQFKKFITTCKKLGFKFDSLGKFWEREDNDIKKLESN